MDAESTFRNAIAMCQMYLRQKASETSAFHTPETIRQAVEAITAMPIYSQVDKARLFEELEIRVTVVAPIHRTLGADEDHEPWLHSKRAHISWRFWERFVLHLAERIPDEALKSLDRITDDVLSRLENPARPGGWDRRGLVMGNVQAGKTDNYCGLICKAADAEYKVIIVLSGIHNNLRAQTQIQLDDGFLGFMSEPSSSTGHQRFRAVGVGEIDGSIHANTGTNRKEKGDFSTSVANQFGIHPGGLPLLFAVKKNVSVLTNLLGWIRSHADGLDPTANRRFVRGVPILVIDDEGDLASVDTRQQMFDEAGNPDLEHDPTRINGLIRMILRSFEKVAYVAYTATPFANIFIHERGTTRELGDDLFPRSFIVSIPPPSNYVGAAKVFGISGEDDAGLEEIEPLPIVRIITDHAASDALDEEHGWMPPRLNARTAHRPLYNGKPTVPPSLREAMMAFVLATTVRKLREHHPHHNSMLIHVVRFTAVQKMVSDQVQMALREILQRLQYGDGERIPTIIDEFRVLWEGENGFLWRNEECRRVNRERNAKGGTERDIPPLPPWKEVAALLREITASIMVRTVNGTARDVLEYEEHRATGMNVIAIGGDKLSRGLTLYGLSVSYFLRASQMYDTLMQMGRWFGYRDGYIDVCRLYTTGELLEWYTHIAVASEELQREFRYMCDIGGTPRDYGLKVRSHPVMLVTSAVKMRHGKEMPLSFSGKISETIIFQKDARWIARNFSATENWLASLGKPAEGRKLGGYKWKDVSAQSIIEFLRSYSTHKEVSEADTALWIKYISTQLGHDELKLWTVLLNSSGPGKEQEISNLTIGLIERDQDKNAKNEARYTARQIVDPNDELAALADEQWKAALALTVKRWEKAGGSGKRPTKPGRKESRDESVRPKTHGLLLIYPLDPAYPTVKEGELKRPVLDANVKPIIGLALSFPESNTARPITYVVNNVFTQRGGDDVSF